MVSGEQISPEVAMLEIACGTEDFVEIRGQITDQLSSHGGKV